MRSTCAGGSLICPLIAGHSTPISAHSHLVSAKDRCAQLFGVRLRALRRKKKLSQAALSELAGLHRHYVSDIERGARNPAVENIARLAWALGTTPAELFAGFTREELRRMFG